MPGNQVENNSKVREKEKEIAILAEADYTRSQKRGVTLMKCRKIRGLLGSEICDIRMGRNNNRERKFK